MIERFYLKEYLSFKESELNFSSGLIVFTGPSGSGKSILINAILASLGLSSCDASICESSVAWDIETNDMGILSQDINTFRHLKKEKSRYFINNQSVSKKTISTIASTHLRHLSLKDFSDFTNSNLLFILDSIIQQEVQHFADLINNFKDVLSQYKHVKNTLDKLVTEQKNITQLKEFTQFELQKITDINPVIGEDEELFQIKKELSKKEKILQNITLAENIFDYENVVTQVLDDLDQESGFFNDTMNILRNTFETVQEKFEALNEVNIEDVLNRIEKLGELKRRYGSIEEAIKYKEEKEAQLQTYDNIDQSIQSLQKQHDDLKRKIDISAHEISTIRKKYINKFEKKLNIYLNQLYLKDAKISIKNDELSSTGFDKVSITLQDSDISTISTGEFNRLRLAVLAIKSEFMKQNGGVLMLDEIDANLSGEESMSVAKVLKKLSKTFQIFVISHQPQLTSMGDQHFLVFKNNQESFVKALNFEQRVNEIARIISGSTITKEAKIFANDLLQNNN